MLALSCVCVLTILQINFFQFPFNWLNLSDENIDKTNNIIFSIATSIIAGYIFYVINFQIANYMREKKTRKLIHNYLVDIITQMKVGQLYLHKTYNAKISFDNLSISDFTGITTLKNSPINFSYQQINTQGNLVHHTTGALSEVDLFYEEMELVKKNIQMIYSFPYISTLDYNLLNILHRIQAGFFYLGVQNISNGFSYVNFNMYAFEHYQNFRELKKYVEPRQTQ